MDIVEFEQRLFPEPVRSLDDFVPALVTALTAGVDSIDTYGREHVAAISAELMSLEAATTIDRLKLLASTASDPQSHRP